MARSLGYGGERILRPSALRRAAQFFVLLVSLSGCVSAARNGDVCSPAPCQVVEEFDIPNDPDCLLVPVTLAGRRLWFVVDTGAAVTVVDQPLRPFVGRRVGKGHAPTAGEDIQIELYDPPKAFLGKLDLREGGPVACVDQTMCSYIAGRSIAGFIGMGLLKRYVLQLDFDNGKLRLLAPVAGVRKEWGTPVDLFPGTGGLPYVRGKVSDAEVAFIVDTGANGSGGLESRLFDRFIAGSEEKLVEVLVSTVAGTSSTAKGRLPLLALGENRYSSLLFRNSRHSLLGLAFLSRHCVTLDFPNRLMYLKRGRLFERPDESNMSGLGILRIHGKTLAWVVDKASPSESAGIRSKDEIVAVNGVEAGGLDLWGIRRLLRSGDGKLINMTIKRGERVFDVSFRLKRRL